MKDLELGARQKFVFDLIGELQAAIQRVNSISFALASLTTDVCFTAEELSYLRVRCDRIVGSVTMPPELLAGEGAQDVPDWMPWIHVGPPKGAKE